MKNRAGKKKVILELGGNAGVIIDAGADLAFAVSRVVAGGFALAGQSCISVQRVYAASPDCQRIHVAAGRGGGQR